MKMVKMLAGLAVAAVITAVTATSGAAAGTPAASDPLEVTLVAQSPIKPNTTCTFTANAYGGTGNYTYYWSSNPSSAIQSASGNEVTVRSSGAFTLTVTVFDGLTSASDTQTIAVSSSALICPS